MITPCPKLSRRFRIVPTPYRISGIVRVGVILTMTASQSPSPGRLSDDSSISSAAHGHYRRREDVAPSMIMSTVITSGYLKTAPTSNVDHENNSLIHHFDQASALYITSCVLSLLSSMSLFSSPTNFPNNSQFPAPTGSSSTY